MNTSVDYHAIWQIAYALDYATPTDDTMITPRLSGQGFQPGRHWWERLFAVVDAGDADAFVSFLTADGQFRFGNAPVVIGADAIRETVAGFFAAIASSHHRLLRTWGSPGSAVCEGEVTYRRQDGTELTFPFANVFEFDGEKIAAYRIYIDNSPLFAPPA